MRRALVVSVAGGAVLVVEGAGAGAGVEGAEGPRHRTDRGRSPDGPLSIEPEYFPGANVGPGGSVGGTLVNPNTRGDYHTPFNPRCPCCKKGQPVLRSTVGSAVRKLTPWLELVPHLVGSNRRPTGQPGALLWFRTGSNVVVPNAFRLLSIPTT